MVTFSSPRAPFAVLFASIGLLAVTLPQPSEAEARGKRCLSGMVSIRGRFCIDAYEAHVVEIISKSTKKKKRRLRTRSHEPHKPVDGLRVRAVSRRGKTPQAYISRNQAEEACKNAGKRLCKEDEWVMACKGKHPTTFPYGKKHKPGYCNDGGFSSFNALYGVGGVAPPKSLYTFANLNDARLNKMKGTLSKTGAHRRCRSSYGTYDMVGNLHEWVASRSGTFRGGYYLDTHKNGDGCEYKTVAHDSKYHDYSTGFRCCK